MPGPAGKAPFTGLPTGSPVYRAFGCSPGIHAGADGARPLSLVRPAAAAYNRRGPEPVPSAGEAIMADPAVLTIHTDGASRGNPGAAAYAYVIARDGAVLAEEAGCLGRLTNNQAEYTALVKALQHALRLDPAAAVLLHSDSELMVRQMNGDYRVKNGDLLPLYEEAVDLAERFGGGVTFNHVRRAQNSRADALCNEALDGKRRPTPPPAAPRPSLRDEAVACLGAAAAAWARGDGPTAEALWDELRRLLERHGVL